MDKNLPSANPSVHDVVIVGGGLAGLVNAILLAQGGYDVVLLEKKQYPFHKVCGEYVSNEVLGFLKSLGFDPFLFGASKIDTLRISDPSGKNILTKLDMGGFGLSRYKMDHQLVSIAKENGVKVKENTRVNDIEFNGNIFTATTNSGIYESRFAIGCYGKRDILDKRLDREFIERHTGYMGVKYHVRCDYPLNEIGLDNFPGGYCGIVKIEDDKYNLCYLYRRKKSDSYRSVRELEEKLLYSNPLIKKIFIHSDFSFSVPEVINEISFDNKSCIEDHVFLCGDSAGLITPLCGNGMAMAIHGAKILSSAIMEFAPAGKKLNQTVREKLETSYKSRWQTAFSGRLFWGRNLQKISGNAFITSASLKIIHAIPPFEKWLINKTHGEELVVG